jgi:hydroxymethylbilane synthase
LLAIRPDLQFAEIRGNLDTRLRKLDAGDYDALILAEAGLRRLGWEARIGLLLAPPVMLPAVGQAAIGVECRTDDAQLAGWLAAISDSDAQAEVLAERACLHALRAGCHAPLGVWTHWTTNDSDRRVLRLRAVVLSLDGRVQIAADAQGDPAAPEQIGRLAAERLQQSGAECILRPPATLSASPPEQRPARPEHEA